MKEKHGIGRKIKDRQRISCGYLVTGDGQYCVTLTLLIWGQ